MSSVVSSGMFCFFMYIRVWMPFCAEWSTEYVMILLLSSMSLHVEDEAGSLKMEVVTNWRVSSIVLCVRIVVAIVVIV